MANHKFYAAGSIVEAIEKPQPSTPSGGHTHDRIVTVKAINPYGMEITTEHYGNWSAEAQRKYYRSVGYQDIT